MKRDRQNLSRRFVAGCVFFGLAIGFLWLPSDFALTSPQSGPSSAPEQPDIGQDADIQSNIGTIEEYAARNATDSYAGLYLDEGLVYVGFTRDAEQHLASLRALVKYPDLLRLFPATYTEAQLNETVASISSDIASLRDEGIMIFTVGTNIPENLVDVTVASADTDTVELLESRYGPQVRVTSGSQPCTAEAKICPDGSAVGRTGPNCEFAACPGTAEESPGPENAAPAEAPAEDSGILQSTGLLLVAGVILLATLAGLVPFLIRRRKG